MQAARFIEIKGRRFEIVSQKVSVKGYYVSSGSMKWELGKLRLRKLPVERLTVSATLCYDIESAIDAFYVRVNLKLFNRCSSPAPVNINYYRYYMRAKKREKEGANEREKTRMPVRGVYRMRTAFIEMSQNPFPFYDRRLSRLIARS